ncbi:MAG: RNB domain-containing ribonuclease, partial [Okeania sp. SIO2D1]|nr:RNB domain-containing ribonuclease [Okeania sp. SIO2D1]
MDKGTLIEFRLNGERRLAVADRPEGKKDWIVIDEQGQSHKLRSQRVEYEVGSGYAVEDISQFQAEVKNYLDPSSLEVAWELLIEEKAGVTAKEMAQLLFSEQSPALCYAAHYLLCEDKIFFKKKAEYYEPRSENQVEEIKHQLEIEEQKQRDKQGFIERVSQRLAANQVEWLESDR